MLLGGGAWQRRRQQAAARQRHLRPTSSSSSCTRSSSQVRQSMRRCQRRPRCLGCCGSGTMARWRRASSPSLCRRVPSRRLPAGYAACPAAEGVHSCPSIPDVPPHLQYALMPLCFYVQVDQQGSVRSHQRPPSSCCLFSPVPPVWAGHTRAPAAGNEAGRGRGCVAAALRSASCQCLAAPPVPLPPVLQFFRQASPYIEGHRGRTFVLAIPGEVRRCGPPRLCLVVRDPPRWRRRAPRQTCPGTCCFVLLTPPSSLRAPAPKLHAGAGASWREGCLVSGRAASDLVFGRAGPAVVPCRAGRGPEGHPARAAGGRCAAARCAAWAKKRR